MSSESPLNLFSHSAKKPKKTEEESPLPVEKVKTTPKSPIAVRNYTVEAMIERMNEMRRDIDNKIEEVSKKHGISREQVMQYLSNPANFTPEQWAFLSGKQQAFFNNIQSNLGGAAELPAGKESSTTTAENRKNKLAGSRRKWIPTR
jgi:hypothetical protein